MSRKSGPDPVISSSKGAERILRRQALVGRDETLKQTPMDAVPIFRHRVHLLG